MTEETKSEYTLGQMGRIVGEDENKLRNWLRRGLLTPSRKSARVLWFDFTELTKARLLKQLLADGVRNRDLTSVVEWVEDVDAGDVIIAGRDFAVRQGDGTIADSRGQTLLDFYSKADPNPAASGNIIEFQPGGNQTESADAQLEIRDALVAEEDDDLPRAEQIYLSLLLRDGPNAEICYNLGNVLYQLDRKPESVQRLRQAVEIDSEYIEAWNNLGVVLSEIGRIDESIDAYLHALDAEPDFVDAIFNLAETLAQHGRPIDALKYWDAYLALDPDSPLADEIRERQKAFRRNS